jgi:hypothetical protein
MALQWILNRNAAFVMKAPLLKIISAYSRKIQQESSLLIVQGLDQISAHLLFSLVHAILIDRVQHLDSRKQNPRNGQSVSASLTIPSVK